MSAPNNNSISSSQARQCISRDDYQLILVELEKLYVSAAAELVLLADTRGLVVASKGEQDSHSAATLSALSSADFAASEEIANLIGEESGFLVHFHKGKTKSLYTYKVIEDIILIFIASNASSFEKNEGLIVQTMIEIRKIFQSENKPPVTNTNTEPTLG